MLHVFDRLICKWNVKICSTFNQIKPQLSESRKKLGSGFGKPCRTRLDDPTAVVRHCPVPKGLRLRLLPHLSWMRFVVRHCPVPKGLRHSKEIDFWSSVISRKTLPCSKGIETEHLSGGERRRVGRKTLPCSKGIETSSIQKRSFLFRRKTLPCSKGIETPLRIFPP